MQQRAVLTFISTPYETMPSLWAVAFFTVLFEKASFWKHDKRTHPTQSHHISMHQRGDVTVLKSALRNVRLSLLFSEDQSLSLRLPTNNHLAPSPCVIWPCPMKAKLSFYNTQPHRLFTSHIKKWPEICQHLQTFEKSSSKSEERERADWLDPW